MSGHLEQGGRERNLTQYLAAQKARHAAKAAAARSVAPTGGPTDMSLLSSITKGIGAIAGPGGKKGGSVLGTLGGIASVASQGVQIAQAVKGLRKGPSQPFGEGGLFPSIPGDIGDIGNLVAGALPSLGMPADFHHVPRAPFKSGKLDAVDMFGARPYGPPAGYHWKKDGTGFAKNRRMNVCNMKAARRAARRLRGAHKMLKEIEKLMPRRPSTRRAPRGHSSHLRHT